MYHYNYVFFTDILARYRKSIENFTYIHVSIQRGNCDGNARNPVARQNIVGCEHGINAFRARASYGEYVFRCACYANAILRTHTHKRTVTREFPAAAPS